MPARLRVGGCNFVEEPARPADRANIIWSASVDPDVLSVVAEPARPGDSAFDLDAFGARAAIAPAADAEHVIVRGTGGLLRIAVVSGTVRDGPALLAHRLTGVDDLEAGWPALRQLARLCALGPAAPWIIPPDPKLDRLILALRALDARREGASLREIAMTLAGPAAEWPGEGESTKSWVRRLVALSESLWRAGPRGILAGAI